MILQFKQLLCLVFIIINRSVAEDPLYRSDYTFVENLDGWMKFHGVPAPWHEARRRCSYEGAVLSSPYNKEFTSVMKSALDAFEKVALFTGLHATFSRGDYYTVDGIPYSMSQSVVLEAQLSYSSDLNQCAILNNRGIVSASCDSTYPYVCYKKSTPLTMNVECGTTDPDYHYENSTGHCYKVHKVAVDWSRAFTICSAEGGYLAIPSGPSEAALLASLAKSNWIPLSTIGYKDWEGNEEWYTVHGTPIPYERWSGENADKDKNCAALNDNSVLVKKHCEDKQEFICEKHPISLQIIKI